jgi:crossover junction endodeoxyribonuclease RuvC
VIVLGIDPGSRRCGYAAVARDGSKLHLVASGVLQLAARTPLAERLARILDGLREIIARVGAEEAAIESVFSGTSPRSALALGQARGVAMAAAAGAGLPVYEYAPAEVKLAFTGNGRAEKVQMIRMAHALLGVSAKLSDEADAIAVAVCHLARRSVRSRLEEAARQRRSPALREHGRTGGFPRPRAGGET